MARRPPTSSHRGNTGRISKRFKFKLSVFCGGMFVTENLALCRFSCTAVILSVLIWRLLPSSRLDNPRLRPTRANVFFEERGTACEMHWLLLRMKGSDCSGFSWIVSIMVNGFSKCQSSCVIDLASQRGEQTHLDGILPVLPRRLSSARRSHTPNQGGNVDFTLCPLCDT